jgi:hypothetical protein
VTVLSVALAGKKLQPKPLWLASGPAIVMTLFTIWLWLQMPLALDLDDHLMGTVKYTKYVLAYWFFYRIMDSKDRVRDMLFLHVFGCSILGMLAMLEGRSGGRLDGVGGPGIDDANTLGMYLVTGTIIAFGLTLAQTGWRRIAALGCMAICAQGFILTNSRGAFLGLVAAWLVLAACKSIRHRRVFWGFAVVGVLGLAVLIDDAFVNRMFTIRDVASDSEEADTSARSRVEVAKAQLLMFLDHPIGTGHRGTVVLSTRYLDAKWLTLDKSGNPDSAARSSHNSFLSALVEQGFIGAVLFICYVFWLVGAMLRVRRLGRAGADPQLITMAAAMCAAQSVVFVAGNTADYLMAEVQFWMYAGLVSSLAMAEASVPGRNPSPTSPAAGPKPATT